MAVLTIGVASMLMPSVALPASGERRKRVSWAHLILLPVP